MDWSKAGLCWHPAKENIKIEHPVVHGLSPVRLELAGGWSDTPPYCQDLGGNVLNAAITIDGQKPVSVKVSRCDREVIITRSGDYEIPVYDIGTLLDYTDLQDPSSIVKVAILGAGIVDHDESVDLKTLLNSFGGGLKIELDVALPYGSGLGTSSILAYTIISCLAKMFGIDYCTDELSNRTIYAEQLLGVVGGWQDQLGGCIGGLKLISTKPGVYQKATIRNISVHSEFWNRCMLYYTGYRRVAKDILDDIMQGYDPYMGSSMETLIRQNEYLAQLMFQNMHAENYDAVTDILNQVWELHQTLHPMISTEETNSIEKKISHLTDGMRILGAGNGGFMYIVAKDPSAVGSIREILKKDPPNKDAYFVDFEIDPVGLELITNEEL